MMMMNVELRIKVSSVNVYGKNFTNGNREIQFLHTTGDYYHHL